MLESLIALKEKYEELLCDYQRECEDNNVYVKRAEEAETKLKSVTAERDAERDLRRETTSARYETVNDERSALVAQVAALREAADNAASWIENYPLNVRAEFQGDWHAIAEALREALVVGVTDPGEGKEPTNHD